MRHDDHRFVPVLIEHRMHSSIKPGVGLICCFASKHKLTRFLKELKDRTLKGIVRQKWHIVSIMFMQFRENL